MARLFVGNVPFRADEALLLDTFQQAGIAATAAVIVYDRHTGESRGFGFVTIDDHEDPNKVVEVHSRQLECLQRPLVLDIAKPQPPTREDPRRSNWQG